MPGRALVVVRTVPRVRPLQPALYRQQQTHMQERMASEERIRRAEAGAATALLSMLIILTFRCSAVRLAPWETPGNPDEEPSRYRYACYYGGGYARGTMREGGEADMTGPLDLAVEREGLVPARQ